MVGQVGRLPAMQQRSGRASRLRMEDFTTERTCSGISRLLVESMALLRTSEPLSCPLHGAGCEYNEKNRIYECGGVWIDGGLPCNYLVERIDAVLNARGSNH